MITYEKWGSFLLDKNGDAKVSTVVAADHQVSDKVLELEKQGLCEVTTQDDGSRLITYKGIDRGAYLALGELQQAVINILGTIKNSASMKKLMENAIN